MIGIFHSIVMLIHQFFIKKIRVKIELEQFGLNIFDESTDSIAQYDRNKCPIFSPPVYRQRLGKVYDILINAQWRDKIERIADFGCGSLGLNMYIKGISVLKELLYIDIDEETLKKYLYCAYPLRFDYIKPRSHPFHVSVLQGSVYYPDERFLNVDAVTAIELIEHLYPDVSQAFVYNVFGYMQPKLAIITTPNADFNVVFPRSTGFRHDDHKFEWTREEFTSWALNITQRFPDYVVIVHGIGHGPIGTEKYGYCSQIAVFIKKELIDSSYVKTEEKCICTMGSQCKNPDDESKLLCKCLCMECCPKLSYGICTHCSRSQRFKINDEESYYKLLGFFEYPFFTDNRSKEEKVLDEVKFKVSNLGFRLARFYNEDKGLAEIPLSELIYGLDNITIPELRKLLLKFNYKIEECYIEEFKRREVCVIYDPDANLSDMTSDSGASSCKSDHLFCADLDELNWDENNEGNDNPQKLQGENIDIIKPNLEIDLDKKQKALLDSGYQKSPQTPSEGCDLPLSEEKSLNTKLTKYNEDSIFVNESVLISDNKLYSVNESDKNLQAGPSNMKSNYKKPIEYECELFDEVKSITNCIVENSLNKLDLKDDEEHKADLILNLEQDQIFVLPNEPIVLVENGDLANNNRDLEGNNYPAENEPFIEAAVDNIEIGNGNELNIDNNNENQEAINEPQQEMVAEPVEDQLYNELVEDEVARSSREALFDPNSQTDLLEDFEMELNAPAQNEANEMSIVQLNPAPVVPLENNGFPNWLLHILDGEAGEDDDDDDDVPENDDDIIDDEPHFYCQGDGLGVHPSVITIDEDEEEDDEETESTSSNSNSTGNDSVENEVQGTVQDLVSNPQVINNDQRILPSPDAEEFFDVEDFDVNAVTNSRNLS